MKQVHVECLPDETLVKVLGFTKNYITHHAGKSTVLRRLGKVKNELAMIDEDPGTAKTSFEKGLRFISSKDGIIQYTDNSGNKVVVLQGKLEDWILAVCKRNKIDISSFGLPSRSSELHEIINDRLRSFERLIAHLIKNNIKDIITLKNSLK